MSRSQAEEKQRQDKHDAEIRADERRKVMDEFGILHGQAAKEFFEYVNNTDPEKSPESEKVIRRARNISKQQ